MEGGGVSPVLSSWPGTGGFHICRGSSPLTVRSSLLAETAGSHVSELGLGRSRVSCQGGHLRGLLTARLLFRGGDFSPILPGLGPLLALQVCTHVCTLPLGALGPHWPRNGCLPPTPSLSIRGIPKGIAPVGIGPKPRCLLLSW